MMKKTLIGAAGSLALLIGGVGCFHHCPPPEESLECYPICKFDQRSNAFDAKRAWERFKNTPHYPFVPTRRYPKIDAFGQILSDLSYQVKNEIVIPYIALILLLYIGGKMLISGIRGDEEGEKPALGIKDLMIQGIATSIDALSVGFTIADQGFMTALIGSVIIAVVTFVISIGGVEIGKAFGTRYSRHAQIIGGCILIFIGVKIFFGF